MLKKALIFILIINNLSHAGIIGKAVDIGKDKAKDKVKEKAVDIYKKKRAIQRENESKLGNESLLTKTENKVSTIKQNTINKSKKIIGEENLKNLKSKQENIENSLIGKKIN
jgi:hypothetical protein